MTVELLRTFKNSAKGKVEGGYHGNESILVTRPPSLLASSKYRDYVLEIANTVRTKSYKYTQVRYQLGSGNEVCAMGLYFAEKYGTAFAREDLWVPKEWYPFGEEFGRFVADMNDDYGWTFDQIADELERGVSIIQ